MVGAKDRYKDVKSKSESRKSEEYRFFDITKIIEAPNRPNIEPEDPVPNTFAGNKVKKDKLPINPERKYINKYLYLEVFFLSLLLPQITLKISYL